MCQNSSSFFLAESNRLTEEQSKVMRMPTSTKKMSVKHGHFAVQTSESSRWKTDVMSETSNTKGGLVDDALNDDLDIDNIMHS